MNNILLKVYIVMVVTLFFILLFAHVLAPYDPYTQDLNNALQVPGFSHLLGTDEFGRDIFSRVIIGGKFSVFSAVFIVFFCAFLGSFLGMVCAYFGGKTDAFIMRLCDVFFAFPGIVLAIAVAGALGGGLYNAIFALCLITWPKFTRLARAESLKIVPMPFIAVAKMNKISWLIIISRHVFPNIFPLILTTAVVDIAAVMMEIAALSFIGLGVSPPTPEWGAMLTGGIRYLQTYPWLVLAPALAIFLTTSLFNLLGEAVKEKLY